MAKQFFCDNTTVLKILNEWINYILSFPEDERSLEDLAAVQQIFFHISTCRDYSRADRTWTRFIRSFFRQYETLSESFKDKDDAREFTAPLLEQLATIVCDTFLEDDLLVCVDEDSDSDDDSDSSDADSSDADDDSGAETPPTPDDDENDNITSEELVFIPRT